MRCSLPNLSGFEGLLFRPFQRPILNTFVSAFTSCLLIQSLSDSTDLLPQWLSLQILKPRLQQKVLHQVECQEIAGQVGRPSKGGSKLLVVVVVVAGGGSGGGGSAVLCIRFLYIPEPINHAGGI